MARDEEDRQTWRAARGALGLLRFDWSEERVALLRQRWAEGLSASAIAKEFGFGVSRCAVLGKVHRLKLVQPKSKRHHPRAERAVRRLRPRPTARSKRAGVRAPSQLMAAFHALGLDALFGEPDTRTVHQHAGKAFGPACGLLDLTAATCRWPVGEPGVNPFKKPRGNAMGRAWMPLYVGDYLRDTRDLNTLQHGAYLLLIMHYWQHDALPTDDARLAAITGLPVAQWRRIREPVQAKFSEGWKHKRIEAELAKTDRALMQRRRAGRSGGIKSGIARAVTQGEAIIRAEAQAKRALHGNSSGPEAGGQAERQQPRTNHNQRSISSSENHVAPGKPESRKPANQWSRQELDALSARRGVAGRAAAPASTQAAPSNDAASHETPANPETGD